MRWKVHIEWMWTFRTECSFHAESPHLFYVDFPTHAVWCGISTSIQRFFLRVLSTTFFILLHRWGIPCMLWEIRWTCQTYAAKSYQWNSFWKIHPDVWWYFKQSRPKCCKLEQRLLGRVYLLTSNVPLRSPESKDLFICQEVHWSTLPLRYTMVESDKSMLATQQPCSSNRLGHWMSNVFYPLISWISLCPWVIMWSISVSTPEWTLFWKRHSGFNHISRKPGFVFM